MATTTIPNLIMRRALLALAAVAASLLMFLGTTALPAQAQSTTGATIPVNTDRDAGFNDEYCSLREAVEAANDNQATVACPAGSATGEDTIVFQLGAGTNIDLSGDLSITDAAGLVVDGGANTRIVVSVHDSADEGRIFFLYSGAKLALRNLNVFDGHEQDYRFGGAVVNRGTLEVTNSTFANNSAGDGGAIYNTGTLKVTNSAFANNSANNSAGDGGAIYNQGGMLEVSSSTFSGNSATYGGGIRNSGTLTAVNTTFSGNSATYGGGAIDNGGTLTATNSTFANNSANLGGAISNGGTGNTATLRSTILANNASGGNCYGTIADGGHNIEDANACGFDQANNSKSGTDPKLETDANGNPVLRNNGGPTQTIALLQNSPAKDAIPEDTNGCGTDVTTDQRGVKRPQWSACDAGTFEIEKPNDLPVANDDEAATDEDTATGIDVLTNDSDPEGDALSVESFTDPANGRATKNPDGTLRYEPDKDYNGSDSFTYKLSDGNGGTDTATVSVTVGAVNDAPGALEDSSYATDEDTPLTVAAADGVLNNDTDPDNDPLEAVKVDDPAHGAVTLGADGSFAYEPDEDYAGSDSFTYKATDGALASNTATVKIVVQAVNDAPEAGADEKTTPEDTPLSFPAGELLANDSEGPGEEAGQTLTVTEVSNPRHGTVDLAQDGTITFAPEPGYNGDGAGFDYTVCDDGSPQKCSTETATVNVTVGPVNSKPEANDGSETMKEDGAPITIDFGALVSDKETSDANLTYAIVAGPSEAQGVLSGSGPTYTFDSAENYNGAVEVTYKVTDRGDPDNCGEASEACAAAQTSDEKKVTITVNPAGDAPVADDKTLATEEDTVKGLALAAEDIDGDELTFRITTQPEHGTLGEIGEVTCDGAEKTCRATVTYAPDEDYNGPDSFEYAANDANGGEDAGTVAITVAPVNDAPQASDDSYSVEGDEPLDMAAPGVLKNDSDLDGGDLSAAVTEGPEHGTLELKEDGSFVYAPGDSFGEGGDSFAYTVSDGDGGTDTATVTIGRACTVTGTSGKDVLRGTKGRDVICGLSGDDKLYGFDGEDVIYGDAGDDRLFGARGNDLLSGGSGKDRLYGNGNDDRLILEDGVERNDVGDGGKGRDTCVSDPRDRVKGCP